jgi:hypothetical protein
MKIEFKDPEAPEDEENLFETWEECAKSLAKHWLNGEVREIEDPVKPKLHLSQYQCQTCGRFFYINDIDKSDFDIEFGCVYGCDDAGKHTRDFICTIEQTFQMESDEQ